MLVIMDKVNPVKNISYRCTQLQEFGAQYLNLILKTGIKAISFSALQVFQVHCYSN